MLVIILAETSYVASAVEQLMTLHDLERPTAPYRGAIAAEEIVTIAQQQGFLSEDLLLLRKLQQWYGYPCSQDEQGYYSISQENPDGRWDGWILHDVQTDVYRLSDTSVIDSDPIAVVTPDGCWLHCPTKNLTRRFVAPELFPLESFLSQQQDLKRADLFFLETINRIVPTSKEK